MKQACLKFSEALYEFLSAINSQDVRVAAVAECVEATEETPVKEKREKKEKWPKRFANWNEGREDVFKNVACTEWNKNKVVLMHTVEQTVDVEDLIGEVVDELRNLSGNMEIEVITKVIETKPVPPPAKKAVEPPKQTQSVTADQVKSACVACSSKLKDKEKVRAILVEVGGTAKVDDMDPALYPKVWNALKQATETSVQTAGANEEGW